MLLDRLFEPLESGPLLGKAITQKEFEELLTMHYEATGWDPKEGVPKTGKLGELNLFWLDENLKDKR